MLERGTSLTLGPFEILVEEHNYKMDGEVTVGFRVRRTDGEDKDPDWGDMGTAKMYDFMVYSPDDKHFGFEAVSVIGPLIFAQNFNLETP
jgi:hypothetical protein